MKLKGFSGLFGKIKEKRAILSAQIGLTNRCNENCIHCLVCKTPINELSTQELKSGISVLRELNCMEITFTGGEPMLREDFFEILNFTKRKGIGIKIISNGTLINESNIRRLKEIAPLNIQISLYGATARIHDFTTRLKGSFEKTMHAIELLKANKLSFAITTMVLNHNFNELSLMKDMAKKRKWEILFDFIIRPMDSGSKKPLKHRVTDNQIKNAYNLNLLPFVNKNRKLKHYNKRDICVGNIGRTHIFISSEGGVFPDITLRTKIGDLRKNSIYDIWYNSKKLNWLRNLNLSDFECSKCKYLLNCSWITGLALAEHHDLFKRPKEYCRFIKYIVS